MSVEENERWMRLHYKYSHIGCPAAHMEDNCAHPDQCADNGRCLRLSVEIAWLIERPQHARPGCGPVYFGWEEGRPGWTADINYAIRSETKDEAEQFANDIGIDDWIVVEHAFERTRLREGAPQCL